MTRHTSFNETAFRLRSSFVGNLRLTFEMDFMSMLFVEGLDLLLLYLFTYLSIRVLNIFVVFHKY